MSSGWSSGSIIRLELIGIQCGFLGEGVQRMTLLLQWLMKMKTYESNGIMNGIKGFDEGDNPRQYLMMRI